MILFKPLVGEVGIHLFIILYCIEILFTLFLFFIIKDCQGHIANLDKSIYYGFITNNKILGLYILLKVKNKLKIYIFYIWVRLKPNNKNELQFWYEFLNRSPQQIFQPNKFNFPLSLSLSFPPRKSNTRNQTNRFTLFHLFTFPSNFNSISHFPFSTPKAFVLVQQTKQNYLNSWIAK